MTEVVEKKCVDILSMHQVLVSIPFRHGEVRLSSKLCTKILDSVSEYDDIVDKYNKEVKAVREKMKPVPEICGKMERYESLMIKKQDSSLTEEEMSELSSLKSVESEYNKYMQDIDQIVTELGNKTVKVTPIKFSDEEYKSIQKVVCEQEFVQMPAGNQIAKTIPTLFILNIRRNFVV